MALPSFNAFTVPFSSTLTTPELSATNVTSKPLGLVVYLITPESLTFNSMSSASTLASFKVTVTVMTVEFFAYTSSSPTLMVILAVPFFNALTVPSSSTLTMPELSAIKLTFNPSGATV